MGRYFEAAGDLAVKLLGAAVQSPFYNASIKGRFDCRTGHVPTY
jgi:hypothetical protein